MEDVIEQSIPIFFFALVGFIVFWAVQANSRTKRLAHEERMLAIEKGADIPISPAKKQKDRNPFVTPFVLIAISLALMLSDSFSGFMDFGAESIPLMIGVALLAAHFLYKKYRKKEIERNSPCEPFEMSKPKTPEKPEF